MCFPHTVGHLENSKDITSSPLLLLRDFSPSMLPSKNNLWGSRSCHRERPLSCGTLVQAQRDQSQGNSPPPPPTPREPRRIRCPLQSGEGARLVGSSLPRASGIQCPDTGPACSSSLRTPSTGKFCVCFWRCVSSQTL